MVGLEVSERRDASAGTCECLDAEGAGEAKEGLKPRLAEGPVGGARRAAGPRGGDFVGGGAES